MDIKTLELNTGEFIALNILEITSIPKIANIKDDFASGVDIESEYRKSFGNLLTELYQNYNNILLQNKDASIASELMWLTQEVKNQPFKANIRIFLVTRALSGDEASAINIVERLINTCTEALKLEKYEYQGVSYAEFEPLLGRVEGKTIYGVTKEEKEEHLQIQMLPECYSFDIFDSFALDLSSIVNALIMHPNSILSISLIPTKLTQEETSVINQISQALDTLSKGVVAEGIGSISYSIADNLAEVYKYYLSSRSSALFNYNIIIYSDEVSAQDLVSKMQSYINYDVKKSAPLKILNLTEEEIEFKSNFYAMPWITNDVILNKDRDRALISKYQSLYRMPYIISALEASGLFLLPLGKERVNAGLPINESDSSSRTYGNNLINSGDIKIGSLKASRNDTIGISLKDLAKHMLVLGTPGSGKTTFSVSLLDRLWKDHKIPFLVIEPAKNEYRALVQSIPELQVFTPGKNFISPFVFNPFVPPKNVKLETYKSTLKTAFAAGVSMSTPLDKIFEESINNCYSDFRWLDTYTSDDAGKVFNISDFIKCFEETFEAIGYTGDAKNIGRAGVVRLNSLVNLFDNYFSIPIEDLLKKPTVIELAAIENSDQKALIISLLLLSILAYVNANYEGVGGLKNVILLEEAHVLLDASTNAGSGDANPSAIAQGLVKRMLAEIRSYGVGLIIADQSPRKVSTDVVALTDMKMVFRLVEAQDKEIIANSMNMNERQVARLGKLKPGEAFLFFNRLDEPEEVITPDYRLENNINISLSDESIKNLVTYWQKKPECLKPYPECNEIKYCQKTCNYEQRILAREIARRIFVRNFKPDMQSFEAVNYVFGRITKLVKAELNNEKFSPELLSCVKVHLWRRIKYGTKIPIKAIQIINSLKK